MLDYDDATTCIADIVQEQVCLFPSSINIFILFFFRLVST